jgi:hypothetical protein
LSSFFCTKKGDCGVVVLYAASSSAHKKAYDDVAAIFKRSVTFVEQRSSFDFRGCLNSIVSTLPPGELFFLVDDIIFTEEVDYNFLSSLDLTNTIFSLRMGEHLNYSYVVSSAQPLPKRVESDGRYLNWKWTEGELDWGYPLSVDGHVFLTSEVVLWIKYLSFKSPSSFESALQRLRHIYSRKQGMCYKKSRLFNIPANKVQNEIENLHGSFHQDDLLNKWENGFAIEHQNLRGWINQSVHEEVELHFIKRQEK